MTSDPQDRPASADVPVAADGSTLEPRRRWRVGGRRDVARVGAVVVGGWSAVVGVGFLVSPTPSGVERAVARGAYSLPDASTPVFEAVMQAGTLTAATVLTVAFAVARRWRVAAGTLMAGLVAWVVVKLMKALIERPRPTAALLDHVPRDGAEGWAFPSGHAGVSAALATFVVLVVAGHRGAGTPPGAAPRDSALAFVERDRQPRAVDPAGRVSPAARRLVRWAAVVAAVLTAVARVHLGVHWPLDVLAGAAVGILTGWAAATVVLLSPPWPRGGSLPRWPAGVGSWRGRHPDPVGPHTPTPLLYGHADGEPRESTRRKGR